MRRALFGVALFVAWSAARPVCAHPLVDRAIERHGAGDLAAADQLLTEAEAAESLTRDDVIQILAWRAIVAHAREDAERATVSLRALAAVASGHSLPSFAPPDLQSELTRVALETDSLSIAVEVNETSGSDGALVIARVTGSPAALPTHVVIHHRVGDAAWETSPGDRAAVAAPSGGRVSCYAEVLGWGGAVLAASGTRDAPRVYTRPAVASVAGGVEPAPADDGGLALGWKVLVGAGVAGIGLTLVLTLLAVLGGPSETILVGPL